MLGRVVLLLVQDFAGASRPGVDTNYKRDFLAPFDGASSELRTALRKELT
jgi:hypothetical protein